MINKIKNITKETKNIAWKCVIYFVEIVIHNLTIFVLIVNVQNISCQLIQFSNSKQIQCTLNSSMLRPKIDNFIVLKCK